MAHRSNKLIVDNCYESDLFSRSCDVKRILTYLGSTLATVYIPGESFFTTGKCHLTRRNTQHLGSLSLPEYIQTCASLLEGAVSHISLEAYTFLPRHFVERRHGHVNFNWQNIPLFGRIQQNPVILTYDSI